MRTRNITTFQTDEVYYREDMMGLPTEARNGNKWQVKEGSFLLYASSRARKQRNNNYF